MRKNVIAFLVLCLLFLGNAYAQDKADPKVCADVPGETSGTYKFRRLGETIEIPVRSANMTASEGKESPRIAGEPASVASGTASDADCEPVALELHWANGHNNGSNFNVSFRDNNNRLISAKQISAFMTGVLEFPLSSAEAQIGAQRGQGNEIASIHNAVRLIGASRLPLVQIELKTSRPFPVRDVPLQLQIGKRVFIDELGGDYTGRRFTLSLTPEMFAELKDGDEIVAFFSKPDRIGSADQEVWYFGKLVKGRRQ